MKKVEMAIAGGILTYILIAAIQGFENTGVMFQSVLIFVVLGILAAGLMMKNEDGLRKIEMILLWVCIGLFFIFGALKSGGLI
ncbi:hypothetical protein F1737_04150 [Methanoplanus sp. FWC-SCC4]|uniref:DUF3953 domain-containing protein n=1 Tax=Methanochimaera problematica TaxID=2609417 RepID=A0AA97FCF2_9EURY|nr:hypothetical protein [Methanoplanus sp. FWC-SCC4]WOF15947.1 hypothetical protein F1737_04150 [Methanoplanus sp. FWC-SCC4]